MFNVNYIIAMAGIANLYCVDLANTDLYDYLMKGEL
jgi:hypothetical protein